MKEQVSKSILRYLRDVALIDLSILGIVGLICWFGGWRTVYDYGNGLIWAGVAAFLLGFASLLGGWKMTRSVDYQYAQTMGQDDISQRTRRDLKDLAQSYGFLIRMGVVGIVSIAIGELVLAIFS